MSRRIDLLARVILALAAVLVLPAAVRADQVTSTNWSGYAVHRAGVRFRKVTATWRQPVAACRAGRTTYSAFWIGIGGYSLSSDATEQIGSELDCSASGAESISAWYELVPSPSHAIRMTISAGDTLVATVIVSGKTVTLALADETEHESFSKTVADRTVDVSSAEWIAEAPSVCSSASKCTTLALTDFGSVHFSAARAETARGGSGSVSSALWHRTRIVLGSSAIPSSLGDAGRSFAVDYTSSGSGSGSSPTTSPPTGPGSGFAGGGGSGPPGGAP